MKFDILRKRFNQDPQNVVEKKIKIKLTVTNIFENPL